jgi:hypothetical protein
MGNALVTLILITVVLVGVLTLASGSISSLDMISNSWKQMEGQMSQRNSTQIDCVNATASNSTSETEVIITVDNVGQVSLADFERWDVIVQWHGMDSKHYVEWLPYSSNSTLGNNEWTIQGIFFQGSSETIEPNILNPGEEMEIIAKVYPAVGLNTTCQATISTPNGISSQIMCQRGE